MRAPQEHDAARPQHRLDGTWLRESVFGLNDGLTTILVMVMTTSAVVPAYLSKVAISAILAGTVSMAGGGLLAAVIERAFLQRRAAVENNAAFDEQARDIHLVAQTMQVGVAFLLGGLLPALPIFWRWPEMRWWSYGLSALASILFGLVNAHYTGGGPWRALAMATLFLGVVTIGTLAGVSFGWLLQG